LRVTVADRPYLEDLGYGKCIRAPMPMMAGTTQEAAGSTFASELDPRPTGSIRYDTVASAPPWMTGP
jgi:arylamine N-acetyltransferase